MKEKEIKLIKDLYQHFQPQTEVTDELINKCYDQYGSIRGVLMNLVLKFQPNADVSDAYLDGKLAEYGIITLQPSSPNLSNGIEQQQQNIQTEPSNPLTKNTTSISTDQDSEENNNYKIYMISGTLALFASFIAGAPYGFAGILGALIAVAVLGGVPAGIIYIFHRKNFLKTFAICCGIMSLLSALGNMM